MTRQPDPWRQACHDNVAPSGWDGGTWTMHLKQKLVRRGPDMAATLHYGPPLDPVTGEQLDRSPRWYARDHEGAFIDPHKLALFGQVVTAGEGAFLRADAEHARAWRPEAPRANPKTAIDLMTAPLPFAKA